MNLIVSPPYLVQADEHFESAMEEYSRPEEDVVPYMVCENAYQAVIHYLKAFLYVKSGKEVVSNSPDVLLQECKMLDPRFSELNISIFNQKDKNDDVLMDLNTVNRYMQIAHIAKRLTDN